MVTQTSSSPARVNSYAERHTTGFGSDIRLPELDDLPLPDTDNLAAADIRKLSKALFARLAELEEGTPRVVEKPSPSAQKP